MASKSLRTRVPRVAAGSGRRQPRDVRRASIVGGLGLIGALGWLLLALGLVLLSVSYFRVSGNPDPSFQLRVMSAYTAGGLFCAAAGGILVVSQHYQIFAREYRGYRAERAGTQAASAVSLSNGVRASRWANAADAPESAGRGGGDR